MPAEWPAASTVERGDMYLSTLCSHIDTMGNQLEVVARFPDRAVEINNFTELDQSEVA